MKGKNDGKDKKDVIEGGYGTEKRGMARENKK